VTSSWSLILQLSSGIQLVFYSSVITTMHGPTDIKFAKISYFLSHCHLILNPFKLQPDDGFMKAEICSCYVLLINYILCNKVVLDCKVI